MRWEGSILRNIGWGMRRGREWVVGGGGCLASGVGVGVIDIQYIYILLLLLLLHLMLCVLCVVFVWRLLSLLIFWFFYWAVPFVIRS